MADTGAAAAAERIEWRKPSAYKKLGLELYREFSRDNVTTFASATAYNTVFAIPALLLLIVMAAALVNRATDIAVVEHLRQLINDHAPASTRVLLTDQVDSAIARVDGSGLSVGIVSAALLALWSSSNAIGSLINAFNRAYGVDESRPFVRRKLMTIGLTLMLAVFINLAFALLVFGERIGSWLADWIGAGGLFDLLWGIGRWPSAVLAIVLFLSLLYYWGPNVDHAFRWVTPGSLLSTVLWLIATAGFGVYLRVSNPGSAYGVVGSVLVLLFFLYITAIIFILGAELNAMLAKRAELAGDVDRESAPKPVASAPSRQGANQMRHERPADRATASLERLAAKQ